MQYPSDTIQNKRQSILFGITVWLFIVRIYSHEALPTILTYFTQIQAARFFLHFAHQILLLLFLSLFFFFFVKHHQIFKNSIEARTSTILRYNHIKY